MILKFPNARLFIHDLLSAGGLSGCQAIARSACEFGLVDAEAAADIQSEPGAGGCACAETAKKVLTKYFERKSKEALADVNVDQIWSLIERDVEAHRQSSKTPGTNSDLCGRLHSCAQDAPALFDLMLQQIRRYP